MKADIRKAIGSQNRLHVFNGGLCSNGHWLVKRSELSNHRIKKDVNVIEHDIKESKTFIASAIKDYKTSMYSWKKDKYVKGNNHGKPVYRFISENGKYTHFNADYIDLFKVEILYGNSPRKTFFAGKDFALMPVVL